MAVVYVLWGTTYLGVRIAMTDGGLSPVSLGAIRMPAAGALLLLGAWLARGKLLPSRRDALTLGVGGLLMWFIANGLMAWACARSSAGTTALMMAATPLWVGAIEALVERRRPSARWSFCWLLGLGGVALLTTPWRTGGSLEPRAGLALLVGGVSWAAAVVWLKRRPVQLSAAAAAGHQMAAAGAAWLLLATLLQVRAPEVTGAGWAALSYLVVFGSVVAFGSFGRALRVLPSHVVMTYAYVNPLVALALGASLLGEPISGWTVAGAALLVTSVWGSLSASGEGPVAPPPETAGPRRSCRAAPRRRCDRAPCAAPAGRKSHGRAPACAIACRTTSAPRE